MKIMKYTLWATVGLSLLFASCESILDINPKDRLTTKDYFTNEEQLRLYSNQFYSNNFPGDGDIYKDNADVLIVSPLDDEVSGQRVIPETGGGWSWSALRSINFLLDNLGNCKDQKVRDKYEALARFFRAYFYFEKVKRFGDVPWYDKVLGSDDADLYKARDSREFVMGKIMEDLNFAIEVFKETNRTKELYRVTWWTAQALKSRVGLFEGTYRKYHGLGDYEKYLNDCVSASNEIMTASGGYSLYQSGSQSYRNLFKSENAIDAEIILARDYNNDLSLVHKVQAFENSPTLGRPGLSKKLVNYFYFEKVKRFGDVPWYDKVLGSDDADLYKARDSREFVMGKIMEDLNFAIEVFKETNRTKELYRVTWWTAQALKSRVGLFEGTYRKYHGLGDYEKYLNDCVSASNEIMTASGGYSLYQSGSQSYRNLFKSENAIDAEIILARDYNNDLSLVHKVQAFENSPTLGRPGLSKKLVNYYLMKNGNRFTDQPNYATMEFKDEIVNRDPRLAQTIRTSNINMNVTMTGYHLLKYANDNMSYTGDSSNDLPLFRLAEVYLNYAEAKAELGTLTQTDIDNTINKLRTRAGVTGKLNMNAANLSPDPYMCAPETGYVNVTGDNKGVILEIRRERAIELVMEGFRYYDLMRWKEGQCMAQSFKGFYLPATAINKAYDIDGDGTNDVCFYTTSSQPNVGSVTYVKLASDGSGTSLSEGNYGNLLCYSWIDRTWNENRDYLYPVPRQEITLSDGVVTQNPGWNE